MSESSYADVMLTIAQAFEFVAAITLVAGLLFAVLLTTRVWARGKDGRAAYVMMRRSFGGAILLGLEILVAGDLIRTVAVSPSLENVVVLAIIVLIRTFLSFSLEIEIEGVAPWRRAFVSGASVVTRAASDARNVQPSA